MTGEIDFQTGHSVNFEQFQIESHLDTLGKSNWPYLLIFTNCRSQFFTEFGQDLCDKVRNAW